MDRPQLMCHMEKSTNFSIYDGRWIPCSAKFIVLGSQPKGTGVIQIYEVCDDEIVLVKEIEKSTAFKCGTFGASWIRDRYLATGDFRGHLHVWNLEDPLTPVYVAHGHTQIINCIDGIGGLGVGGGAPELATGSRDGSVKVWDQRVRHVPVVIMEPAVGESRRDCWTVCFGNSYNSEERVLCAGYDNGDIKMFDLRATALRWETNVKNGVCCLEFDRKDIAMNKLVATTLESNIFVFDVRKQHSTKGFPHLHEKAHKSTVWAAQHLPQNRDVFATCGGAGSVCLWKYNYPERRLMTDEVGEEYGVAGTVTMLQNCTMSTQPISSFDWNTSKLGLALCTSFDQTVRVLIATKLHLL